MFEDTRASSSQDRLFRTFCCWLPPLCRTPHTVKTSMLQLEEIWFPRISFRLQSTFLQISSELFLPVLFRTSRYLLAEKSSEICHEKNLFLKIILSSCHINSLSMCPCVVQTSWDAMSNASYSIVVDVRFPVIFNIIILIFVLSSR